MKGFLVIDLLTGANDGVYRLRSWAKGSARRHRALYPSGFWIVVDIVECDPRAPLDEFVPNFQYDRLGWSEVADPTAFLEELRGNDGP